MLSTLKFSSAVTCCGGASLRSPMRLTGCCCRATRTPDQQHRSTTKELLLWGGASLRSPMRLTESPAAVEPAAAMPKPARPKAGPTKRQHCSTTKEQLLCGGASLRSPMRLTGCCCRATRTEDLCRATSASPPSASVRFRRLPRPEAIYHSAVLWAALLPLFFRRRRPAAPFICCRRRGTTATTDEHGIIFPAAKIGFFRLRSLTFPPCWSPNS